MDADGTRGDGSPRAGIVRMCGHCGARLARDNSGAWCSACSRSARLGPPKVPRGFWDVAHMRDALASWHMGRVIYAYRTHPWHGQPLSQDIVAGWLYLTQPQLSRIEGGPAPEDLGKLIRHAEVFSIPGDLLWFKLPGDKGSSGMAEIAETVRDGKAEARMPYAKTSLRREKRELRESMRAAGLDYRQIATEFTRAYKLRPRAAWREAYGWSLQDAADKINSYRGNVGLDPGGALRHDVSALVRARELAWTR